MVLPVLRGSASDSEGFQFLLLSLQTRSCCQSRAWAISSSRESTWRSACASSISRSTRLVFLMRISALVNLLQAAQAPDYVHHLRPRRPVQAVRRPRDEPCSYARCVKQPRHCHLQDPHCCTVPQHALREYLPRLGASGSAAGVARSLAFGTPEVAQPSLLPMTQCASWA